MKGRIASCIIFIPSAVLAAYCLDRVYFEYPLWAFWVSVSAVILSMPVCSLLHELGHTLFGACVKIKALPRFSGLQKFLDASSCEIKPLTDKNLRPKLIFTVSGGLAVNFAFVVLGVVALCVSAVPTWLSVFSGYSAYLFLFNLLPLYLYGGKTDGLMLYELIKNDDNAKVTVAVLTVQAQILKGKAVEEVDEKLLFDLPVIREDDPAFIALTELRYEYFKAKGNSAEAEKYEKRFEDLKQYLN